MNDKLTQAAPDRRTFIKTSAGIAGIGFVAGCLGEDEPDPDEPDPEPEPEREPEPEPEPDEPEFPTQDVQLIIPYGPGGGYDTYVRLVAPYVEGHLPGDQQVRVQNVEGAGGVLATSQVYAAEPDGYTNMIINGQAFVMEQVMRGVDDVRYDLAEMSYYAQISEDIQAIAVGTNTDIETWDEYVEAVQNEEVLFGTAGALDAGSITTAMAGEISGLYPAENVMEHQVIYDGTGEIVPAIMAGDVQVRGGTYHSLLPFVEGGDLRFVMVCTADEEPPEQTPDAPTLGSENVDGAAEIEDTVTGRRVFAGPPDVPDGALTVLRDAFDDAINDDDFRADAEEADRPVQYLDGESSHQAMVTAIEEFEELRPLFEEFA